MIAYRYCSNEEVQELKHNYINGYEYETNDKVNTHEYDVKKKYLHFYLNPDSIYSFDNITPENLLEFRFPNEFDEFRGIGYYYCINDDGNIEVRSTNQLAIPDYLVKKEYVKNIKPLGKEEYNNNIRKLIKNGC